MTDGLGLENQELEPAKVTPVGKDENSSVMPSAKESKDKLGLIASLENDSDVIEHVDQAKVRILVDEIGAFFNCPRSAIEQGLKSNVYIMNDDGFKRYVASNFEQLMKKEGKGEIEEISSDDKIARAFYAASGSSIAQENKKREIMRGLIAQKAKEHADKLGGLTIPLGNGEFIILIRRNLGVKRETSIVHELIHAMANDRGGIIGGFRSGGMTSHRNIDEAATQVLTLAFQHPELTVKDLIESEIKTPYAPIVRKFLVAMYTTSQSGKPFTSKELAEYYFYPEPGVGAYLMQMNLVPRARADVRETVAKWFSTDFKE